MTVRRRLSSFYHNIIIDTRYLIPGTSKYKSWLLLVLHIIRSIHQSWPASARTSRTGLSCRRLCLHISSVVVQLTFFKFCYQITSRVTSCEICHVLSRDHRQSVQFPPRFIHRAVVPLSLSSPVPPPSGRWLLKPVPHIYVPGTRCDIKCAEPETCKK